MCPSRRNAARTRASAPSRLIELQVEDGQLSDRRRRSNLSNWWGRADFLHSGPAGIRFQAGQQPDDRLKGFGTHGIEPSLSLAGFSEQPGPLEKGQVFGDGRSALGEASGNLAGGQLPAAEKGQNLSSGGVGQCVEDVSAVMFHIPSVTLSELNGQHLERMRRVAH